MKVKNLIESTLEDLKGEDIIALDLSGKTSIADYMIVVTGTSTRHVNTLAERVVEALKEAELYVQPPEGTETCDWVIVDAGDVILHVFRPEIRDLYNLEKMWSVSLPVSGLVEVVG